MSFIGKSILESFDVVVEHAQSNGTVTLSRSDGLVISVQPDGSLQTRPAGTNGPFEQCSIVDGGYLYSSSGSVAYLFARK